MRPHGSKHSPVRTVKGRTGKESLPGASALANHAHRHENPFLLAQTKLKNLAASLQNSTAMGSSFGIGGSSKANDDLQPEPAASKVNAPAATESSVPKTTSATLRLSVTRSGAVIVLPTEVAEDIGRLGRPKLKYDKLGGENSRLVFSFPSKQTGYQWSPYKDETHRRLSVPAGIVELPAGAVFFGLQDCDVWEYDEQSKSLIIAMPAELKPPKEYRKGKNRDERPNRTKPQVGDKHYQGRRNTPEEALEELAEAPPQSLDEVTHPFMPEQLGAAVPVDEPQPAPIISPAEVQSVHDILVAADMAYPQAPVTLTAHEIQDLRDCLGVLNNLRQVYGRAIQFSLDTTTGKIGAKVVAEIQI